MSKCDYKGCKREAVSGGSVIADEEDEVYDIALCKLHLHKLIDT